MENNDRKKRLEFLLERQKQKQDKLNSINHYRVLFDECIEALGSGVTIFSNEKSNELQNSFQNQVPFSRFGLIDWNKIENHHLISNLSEVADLLNQEYVEVYWRYSDFPVIKAKFQNVINVFDELIAVESDIFLYIPMKYVIEVYHEGEITIGYL